MSALGAHRPDRREALLGFSASRKRGSASLPGPRASGAARAIALHIAIALGLSSCTPVALRRGKSHFLRGNYEPAVNSIQSGLAEHSSRAALSPKRLFTSDRSVEEAQILLLLSRREAAESRCREGTKSFRRGQLMDADKEFQRAADLDSTNLLAMKMTGQVDRHKASAKRLSREAATLTQRGRYDEATDRLDDVRDLAPTFPHLATEYAKAVEASFQQHTAKAARTFESGSYADAAKSCSLALRRRPQDSLSLGNRDKAVKHHKAWTLSRQAGELASQGKTEDALERYVQALDQVPSFPPALQGHSAMAERLSGQLTSQATKQVNTGQRRALYQALDSLRRAGQLTPGRDDIRSTQDTAKQQLAEFLWREARGLAATAPFSRAATISALIEEAHALAPQLEHIQADRQDAADLARLKRTTWLCIDVQGQREHDKRLAQLLRKGIAAASPPDVQATLQPAAAIERQARERLPKRSTTALDILSLSIQTDDAENTALRASQVASRHLAGAQTSLNPQWDETAQRLDSARRSLDATHQDYIRLRADREAVHLTRLQAQTNMQAAALDLSLKRSRRKNLLGDARAFASLRLPNSESVAKKLAAELAGPLRKTEREAERKRDALDRAVAALSRANIALDRTAKQARGQEQSVMQLQRYLDTHTREQTVELKHDYTLEAVEEALTAEVRYEAEILSLSGEAVSRAESSKPNSVTGKRVRGAHRLDTEGKGNQITSLPTLQSFSDELHQAAAKELLAQLVDFAARRHRRFLDAAEQVLHSKPPEAVENYLCFLALNGGRDAGACRKAREYVESRLRGTAQ